MEAGDEHWQSAIEVATVSPALLPVPAMTPAPSMEGLGMRSFPPAAVSDQDPPAYRAQLSGARRTEIPAG